MKNTFTFPHDFGARNDPELQRLLFKHGPAAGWAYWVVVEMLYEQGGRMPKESYCQVAYAAHVDESLIQDIIEGSTLFKTDKKFFWSDRVIIKKNKRIRGAKHWNWKGGITDINSKIRASSDYNTWRSLVFIRDNYTCQICGVRGGQLEAHHIKLFAEYPELRLSVDNGITLCKQCHKLWHKEHGK